MMKIIEILKKITFYPISFLWEKLYQIRRFLYEFGLIKSYQFDIPIFSVGNITFGGTGKTPFTIWLSKFFEQNNKSSMILTRGYKGQLENNSGIIMSGEKFKMNSDMYGDEALLIARRLTKGGVVVGKKRSSNLNYYFNKIRPDVVLMDDGFQHLKLNRSANIVLFDCLLPLSQYKVAPRGYLREGLTALKDADAIILSRSDQASKQKKEALLKTIKRFTKADAIFAQIKYIPTGVFDSTYNKVWEVDQLKGKRVVCLAAVASPQSFFTLIDSLGAIIVDKAIFPDHHYFTVEELRDLITKAQQLDAVILASEKDIVKIKRISTKTQIYYLEINVEFLEGQDQLEKLILQKQGCEIEN